MGDCIERARPEHVPGICQTHRAAVLGVAAGHYTAAQLTAWAGRMRPESMARAVADQAMTVLVAVSDGEVIGFVLYAPGEVKALYIRPQDGRQGLGSRLLALAEEASRLQGVETLRLTASLNAVAFYETRGFRVTGRDVFPVGDGLLLDCRTMEKCLSPPQV